MPEELKEKSENTAALAPSPAALLLEKLKKKAQAYIQAEKTAAKLAKIENTLEGEIKRLSTLDAVSGSHNRKAFWDELQHAIEENAAGGQFGVLVINLSRFEHVNDTLGYQAGDALLEEVANRLEEALPNEDKRFIARLGSDTFAVLIRTLRNEDDMADNGRRILSTMLYPFKVLNYEIHAMSHIGGAMFPNHGMDAGTLVHSAETAMRRARERGDSSSYQPFIPTMKISKLDRLTLENHLRKGLEKKEFELHFQPEVNLKEEKILNVEGFLRWNSKAMGSTVSPVEFMPLLDETGLIIQVGEWSIHHACLSCLNWQEQFPGLGVTVNISGRQLNHSGFFDMVKRTLFEMKIDPTLLTLDIRESSISYEMESIVESLTQLRKMGVNLAIDDFGIGLTSFPHLRQMPTNVMKIDPFFLKDVLTKSENQIMLKTLISMAESLGMEPVAEGVENVEISKALKNMGCVRQQGYYYSHPLKFEDLQSYMAIGQLVNPNKPAPQPEPQPQTEDSAQESEQEATQETAQEIPQEDAQGTEEVKTQEPPSAVDTQQDHADIKIDTQEAKPAEEPQPEAPPPAVEIPPIVDAADAKDVKEDVSEPSAPSSETPMPPPQINGAAPQAASQSQDVSPVEEKKPSEDTKQEMPIQPEAAPPSSTQEDVLPSKASEDESEAAEFLSQEQGPGMSLNAEEPEPLRQIQEKESASPPASQDPQPPEPSAVPEQLAPEKREPNLESERAEPEKPKGEEPAAASPPAPPPPAEPPRRPMASGAIEKASNWRTAGDNGGAPAAAPKPEPPPPPPEANGVEKKDDDAFGGEQGPGIKSC